eukprot:5029296-Alexandrium_andersonii.AAC.1
MLSAAPAGGVEGLLARLVGAYIQNRLVALNPGSSCGFQRPSGVAAPVQRLRLCPRLLVPAVPALHSTCCLRRCSPA